MPVETGNGGTSVTGNAVIGLRAFICIRAIEMHLKYDGKFRMTRTATPSNLRAIASEFTGKPYARSRKGLETALADLRTLMQQKNLDEMGETAAVNREVGGVAADL